MSAELRSMIRELLQEELAALRLGNGQVTAVTRREEVVALQSDTDLAAFVSRIVHLAQDSNARAAIRTGQHVFRLGPRTMAQVHAHEPTIARSGEMALTRFETGLVTEKAIANLPEGQRSISVGKAVRVTPLARDELQRRNIRIERTRT